MVTFVVMTFVQIYDESPAGAGRRPRFDPAMGSFDVYWDETKIRRNSPLAAFGAELPCLIC